MNEPAVPCANCGSHGLIGDMSYDEKRLHFLCDRQCFDEWADKNFETVVEFYYELNVEY